MVALREELDADVEIRANLMAERFKADEQVRANGSVSADDSRAGPGRAGGELAYGQLLMSESAFVVPLACRSDTIFGVYRVNINLKFSAGVTDNYFWCIAIILLPVTDS